MKTSTRTRLACVVTLALLVLSLAFVISAAASGTPNGSVSPQNANTSARRKAGRKRRTRRRAAAKAPTREVLPVATGVGVTSDSPPVAVGVPDEPPPQPKPQPTPKSSIVSGGVLNGKAISKPQPAYPPIARAARAEGVVTVQILVDESGRVISASAVSGHPLLQAAAVAAARKARFAPTMLSGQPVKVSGVLTYNFVLNPPTPY